MPDPVILSMPYPTSANALWRSVKGRNIASAPYRKWMNEATWHIRSQRPREVVGGYILTITASRPDKRRRDLGNLEKATSDALVKAGVIKDDCDAERIILEWSGAVIKGGTMTVRLEEA